MDNSINTPATSTGRVFKTDSGRSRSMSEDRIKFIEEEYDFLTREIAAWLSGLVGEEVDANLVDSLRDGTILCRVVRDCLPNVSLHKFHESVEKTSFYAKDNIAIFAQACQEMGINKNDCVNASMFENADRKQVVNAILRFAIVGIKFGLKPISVIHSERLKNFIEAMPGEVVADMHSLVEQEVIEEHKQQIKEHVWDWHDDLVMIILLLIIFITLGGMILISYKLISNDERFSLVSYKQFKSDLVSLDHCTSSSITHFHPHLQTLLHLKTNLHSSIDP